jgi:hypothetical protein
LAGQFELALFHSSILLQAAPADKLRAHEESSPKTAFLYGDVSASATLGTGNLKRNRDVH